MLTIEHVRERIEEISTYASIEDHEMAHIVEDELLKLFVNYVANHMDCDRVDLIEMAQEIMKVDAMSFERWCA